MPIHDWTRVDAGLFHDFHQSWTVALRNALNAGLLPAEYFALVEQRIKGPIPDVLTLELSPGGEKSDADTGTCTVATLQPRTRVIQRSEPRIYPRKANRLTVRHRHGKVVAVVEIVSPGNKASRSEFRSFVEKTADLIQQGIHLLVIDLFPPGPRDPHGVHHAIWEELEEAGAEPPPEKPLTLAAYDAGPDRVAYVEFAAVGDPLPEMPLFLRPETYVQAPLEETYQATWTGFPAVLKRLLEPPPAGS